MWTLFITQYRKLTFTAIQKSTGLIRKVFKFWEAVADSGFQNY